MSLVAELVTLTDTSEGFATILTARGPGTGMNRMQITLRNEAAITKYGPREAIEDFPDAVDASDLQAKAQARLVELSDPAKYQQLTVRVSGHTDPFRIGQRVRVSDGELGFTTTAKIVGIDANEDSSTLTLGEAPTSLLDVINAREAEEKRDIALGLPAPVAVKVIPAPTGLTVLVTVGSNSRAIGVEVHVSPVNGFVPDVSTLAARGPGARFAIEGLPTAIRQFVRVRAYDDRGNFSPFTDQISSAARGVGTAELVVGQIDITNAERTDAALSVKTSAGAEVLRLGNITGKSGVPSGTQFGLWGALGSGIYIQGVPMLVAVPEVNSPSGPTGLVANQPAGTSITWSDAGNDPGVAISVPPVPNGFVARVLWAQTGHDLYLRVIGPAEVLRGYGVPERWGGQAELKRSNGTWTAFPHLDTAGTQYVAVRARAGGRITITKTTPAAAREPFFWPTITGYALILFVPT